MEPFPSISFKCPVCKEMIVWDQPIQKSPLVYFHGIPLHAVIVFTGPSGTLKALEGCHSIEVMRNASTFANLMRKFHTPQEMD